jgi:membrane protease YdiL (CAAX protease family)
MNETIQTVLKNRHGELRSGWRILLFLVFFSLLTLFFATPLVVAGWTSQDPAILAVTIAVLGATYLMTRFFNRKPFAAIGLWPGRRAARDAGAGIALGILMMSGIFLVEFALGYASPVWQDFSAERAALSVLQLAASFALGAAFEELLFRGYAFQTLIQAITLGPAVLAVSVLFAISHVWNPNSSVFGLINVALAGIWLSFAYFKTRGLWLPLGLHFGWNFAQTAVFGFPTSGAVFPGLRPVIVVQSGPDWATGGTFGPEGGVLATVALVASTWFILKSRVFEAPPGVGTLDSVEDLVRPGPSGRQLA